jgi:hypothetical protein
MPRHQSDPIPRFMAKIDVLPSGCWEWNASKYPSGYGQFAAYGGKSRPAHIFAYESHRGKIDAGSHVHHLCENRWCVNPEHLELVSIPEHVRLHPKGPSGNNAAKTHCINGHEFTEQNTYRHLRRGTNPGWRRHCRTCLGEAQKRHRT